MTSMTSPYLPESRLCPDPLCDTLHHLCTLATNFGPQWVHGAAVQIPNLLLPSSCCMGFKE